MSTIQTNTLTSLSGESVNVNDIANMFKEFATNGDALSGGLVVGNFYYNTTDKKITKVE